MPKIVKIGPASGIIPTLSELHAIKQLKQSWKNLVETALRPRGTFWRAMVDEDWSDVRQNWKKIKYCHRQPQGHNPALDRIIEGAPTGKRTEAKLKKAVEVHSELAVVWGREYNHPEKMHSKLKRLVERSEDKPTRINSVTGDSSDWIFKGNYYRVPPAYSDAQAKLLILREYDREREFFEHLHRRYSDKDSAAEATRERIPERVRIQVWRRDGGKCARCGSREKLEYDHIIPVSKGGSNTARNIELLCEKCNRAKGASIR